MALQRVDVVVGRIGKPHGLRGEVTIDVRTDEPEVRYGVGGTLRAQAPGGADSTLTVSAQRWHRGVLLVRFAEATDRTAAERLRGSVLWTSLPADARPQDPEEYYDHQLVGLTVVDLDGRRLGRVTAVVHGAAQDLLSVRTADDTDALVPFVSALVPEVDLEAGRIVVADRPGLVTPFPDKG